MSKAWLLVVVTDVGSKQCIITYCQSAHRPSYPAPIVYTGTCVCPDGKQRTELPYYSRSKPGVPVIVTAVVGTSYVQFRATRYHSAHRTSCLVATVFTSRVCNLGTTSPLTLAILSWTLFPACGSRALGRLKYCVRISTTVHTFSGTRGSAAAARQCSRLCAASQVFDRPCPSP